MIIVIQYDAVYSVDIKLYKFHPCMVWSSFVYWDFLRYSMSASLADVSTRSLMKWAGKLMRRLRTVALHSFVFVLVCSSMLVIFLGQCMHRIFLRCLLWKWYFPFCVLGSTFRCYAGLTLWRIYGEWAYECNSPSIRNDRKVIARHS